MTLERMCRSKEMISFRCEIFDNYVGIMESQRFFLLFFPWGVSLNNTWNFLSPTFMQNWRSQQTKNSQNCSSLYIKIHWKEQKKKKLQNNKEENKRLEPLYTVSMYSLVGYGHVHELLFRFTIFRSFIFLFLFSSACSPFISYSFLIPCQTYNLRLNTGKKHIKIGLNLNIHYNFKIASQSWRCIYRLNRQPFVIQHKIINFLISINMNKKKIFSFVCSPKKTRLMSIIDTDYHHYITWAYFIYILDFVSNFFAFWIRFSVSDQPKIIERESEREWENERKQKIDKKNFFGKFCQMLERRWRKSLWFYF